MYKYLETYKLLPYFQYGYRKRHNTSQAILDFTRSIEANRKNKLTSIAVFMDLSKAFDTVDKHILFIKLQELGFDITSRELILDYMTDRDFCFGNETDKRYKLDYGVPQGSILGPLLFIIYTYDMKHICPFDKTIMYADDTTIIVSGKTVTETTQKCNAVLNRFLNYFNLNKLSINLSKTKYMIYPPNKHNTRQTETQVVKMNNDTIEKVNSIKFLGVILNSKLTWEEHKQYLFRKISKTIGIIYKCKDIMTETEQINMYKTFIQSNFMYAIEAWGHSVVSESDILNKLQNKVIRILFDCRRSQDAWRQSNNRILTLPELYKKVLTRICIKHHHNLLPDHFSSNIMPTMNTSIHSSRAHTLRSDKHRLLNYLPVTQLQQCFTVL